MRQSFMTQFKKKVSLLMALVMVLSLLAPFAAPVAVIAAEQPIPTGGITTGVLGTAFGGQLRTTVNARLAPAAGRPAYFVGPDVAGEGSVLLNWDVEVVPFGVTGAFMDVLRFFDNEGNRHEFTVTQLQVPGEVGLLVNYDVFRPRFNDDGTVAGYVHISDPVHGPGASVGDLHIWVPGLNAFESAYEFIVTNNRNYPVVDSTYGTRLNQVNDRRRFADIVHAGDTPHGTECDCEYTPAPANLLNFGAGGNFNSSVPGWIPNPDFDATEPPDDTTNPLFLTHFPRQHYYALTPSFSIGEGRGYSFRFGPRALHFRWENGQFFLYIENTMQTGNIYDFVLERYSGLTNVQAYLIGGGTPAPNYLTTANTVTRAPLGMVYVHTGINVETMNAIPFAANRGIPGDDPNTRAARMAGEPDLINDPVFDTTRLDMRAHPPIAEPAEQDLGLDVRFNLPAFFDERLGGFYYQITNPDNSHEISRQLGVALQTNVGLGETPEDFSVNFPLTGMPLFPGNWGEAELSVRETAVVRDYEMGIRNVSLLHREGQEYADRVRVKVGGLSPSIAYEWVMLSVTPIATVGADGLPVAIPTNFLNRGGRVGDPQRPFYTFLNFRFDTLLGTPQIIAEPFNRRVAHIPGFGVRVGYYQLQSDIPIPGGIAPTRVTETTTEVFFSLPDFAGPYRGFFITQSATRPDIGAPFMLHSQDVWWTPSRLPSIDIPDRFSVSNVLHRPMRGDEHAGHLSYTVQWNIASHRHIMALLGYPTNEFGNATDVLRVSYVIGHSTAPETESLIPGAANVHREYIRVDMEIRRNDALPSRLEIRYAPTAGSDTQADVSDFVPSPPHVMPPIPPRFLGNADLPATTHPVDNRYFNDGWLPLEYRPDPARGENMLFASIDIMTNSVRNFRYPPPPQNLRRDFHFPGTYFMNVRLNNWGIVNQPEDRGGESPWTLFDYIVVDDFGTLDPPPPANISVVSQPRPHENPLDPTVQPWLDVSFAIPTGAVLTYLRTLYPMETQVTTNLYVGLFEEAILDGFFPYAPPPGLRVRQPVHPRYREDLSVYSVAFDDARLGNAFVAGRTELDISAFQRMLRGEQAGTGVLRIEGIPLIHHNPVNITTPQAITFAPGDIVNFATAGTAVPDRLESFEETYRILNLPVELPIHLRLTGVDENVAFFLFADLAIQKWVEENGTITLREDIPPHHPNPAISDLTGVVTDTTVGTPRPPEPGEVYPPAPENIGVRDIEQMAATIYWDPFVLTPAEVDDENVNITIEWEIIRIQDGVRKTDAQMNYRNPSFTEVFNGMVEAPRRKGWITDHNGLTVMSISPPALQLSVRQIADARDHSDYAYNRTIVELNDQTLHPNSLYFYYVRTVRIEQAWNDQMQDYVLIRSVSSWVEVPVTTKPIAPPQNLRQENPGLRPGFNGQTMALVSWMHPQMDLILAGMGRTFEFQYQIREGEDAPWRPVVTVPHNLMTASRLDPYDPLRIQYLLTGLEHSSVYQMRVRLRDITAGDHSLWSNTITILTEMCPEEDRMDGDTDAWLRYLRRRLEELLRQPFWTAQRTPTSSILVYRPSEVFYGLMMGTPGTAIPLYNTGANHIVYYLPLNEVLTANQYRRGFSTSYDDMELLLAPSLLNDAQNQAVMDMLRAVDVRGSQLSDSFVRMQINRSPVAEIFGVPAITPRANVTMSLVGTSNNIRNIRSWDRTMSTRAERIIENWLSDPVVRAGITEKLIAEYSNEDISDHIYHLISRVEAEVIREVNNFMTISQNGILTTERFTVQEFNAPMHVVARNVTEDMFVSGHRWVNNIWQQGETLFDYHNGRAFVTRAPGEFAFAGRRVDIPGIEEVPRGPVVVSIVARYGLEDLFGVNVDMQANANRQMVIGSIARAAGVPQGADAFAWANANLNVQMSSRNATGLISNQEAIATVMALYEHRTNTRLNTIRVNNMVRTANMGLDTRYAEAVRAAFELGIITDNTMNPSGSVTIGEFLDMLTRLNARVRV